MARGETGQLLSSPPIIWSIESDPVLAGTKVIAEAWDAAGLYQVGSFTGDRFSEWNGQFRDDVRRFMRGDNQSAAKLASRIIGSPDIYVKPDREPNRSINFITCHDGFTLADLVSYNVKHNEANGEHNADGANDNFSWNCGVEGPGDGTVEKLRKRQIKNFLFVLLTSQGTPMLLMGDEVCRSQRGNNNAYCQNSPLTWFDWDQLNKSSDILAFVKKLVSFVQAHAIFQQERLLTTHDDGIHPFVEWHGVAPNRPDWTETSHAIAFTLCHPEAGERFFIVCNSYWEPLSFVFPPAKLQKAWRRIIDTSLESPKDFLDASATLPIETDAYSIHARSLALFIER
jgi:glycogen operon protein